VLETIGNSAISTHTIVRAMKSYPNQKPMSGTTARIGIDCRMTAYGKVVRSTHFARFIATAQTTPMTIAMTSPTSATWAVFHSASKISGPVLGSV